MKPILLTLVFLSILNSPCFADQKEDQLRKFFGNKHITVTPYDKHLNEVTVDTHTYFSSLDGRYIYSGSIFDTQIQQDIVELRTRGRRLKMLEKIPENSTFIYPAITEEKHLITVFTDIDCGYCRKLHSQIGALNTRGISVKYIMLPRAGVNSQSYAKAVSAACSKNPNGVMDQAMKGEDISSKNCANTIAKQMQLANELNIGATPTILLPNGSIKAGFMTVDRLLVLLSAE